MSLKTYNTESDDIAITFTGQNGRPLETKDEVNSTLLIKNRNDRLFYRTRKYVKG